MIKINVTLGVTWTIISFGFFLCCRYLIRPLTYYRLATNKQDNQIIISPPVRSWFTYTNEARWQRLNLLISWLHALITGVLVLYCFLAYSGLRNDFVQHVNFVTYITCSLSFGYFCYDLCDVLSNRRGADLLEIILHHAVVLIFFGWNIICIRNIGYQMFALLAEVNSIFLHARKLFYLFHIPKENFFVRLNMILNIFTFFFCRLCMLVFVTIFVYHDRYRVGDYYYLFVSFILIPVMWIINPILFYRVLHTDFLKQYRAHKIKS
ncbi:unnamed protein product [Adineta steineri]|uniref:TLC domain-containing protein n=1 Tax=Adineta steineri TaxID=433720 RepID=A0A813S8M8_9BILA|nr:unnamed protein product [Adineta steineri]CAF0792765.1 unnamed protein product [Adineta steineri]CAF0796931.1 unnamed protein product [Adineta steineri]CAF1429568.1 unnamed protein product [Adineta steineri]CAF1623872.1 unnamed protein product [Adineta steineri]